MASVVMNVTATMICVVPRRSHPRNWKRIAKKTQLGTSIRSAAKSHKWLNFPSIVVSKRFTLIEPFILINFFHIVPPDTRTIRSCGFEAGNYANRCYQRSGFGGRQEVCACEGELCNSAVKLRTTFGVVLSILVAIIARF